jgi:hypothetical protein
MKRIYPRRGDLLAVLLAIVVIGGFAVMASMGQWRLLPNFGFGPEWRCTYVGEGEPVCGKDISKPPQPK